jgi:chromosome segregation ATPase
VADLREALDRKECFIEELNAQLLDAQSSHAEFASENQQQLALYHGEISTLQSQLDEVQRHHKDTMAYMEQQLTSLMQKKSELTTRCDEYRDELERVQRESFEANRSNSERETKYAEQVFKLEGENLELSAALKIAQDSLSSMHYLETNGAKLRVRELEEDAEVLHENIQSLVFTIEELRQAKEELIHENSTLVRALEDTGSTDEQEKIRVAQEGRELRTMRDQYQKASADAEQTISDLKVQIQALQDSKEGGGNEFQSLFDDLSEEFSETKKALERVQVSFYFRTAFHDKKDMNS